MTDYTAKEAAPLLGISPGSMRTFIKRGLIVATKRGRDWFITQDEIDRYNRERRKAGQPPKRKPKITCCAICRKPIDVGWTEWDYTRQVMTLICKPCHASKYQK